MREQDFTAFGDLIDAAAGMYGKSMSPIQKAMYFRQLSRFTLAAVQAALDSHMSDESRGRWMPVPADLISRLTGSLVADGRPTADEAWANAFNARNEEFTVVWTAESRAAFFKVTGLLGAGDRVAARVAFVDYYNRLVAEARSKGEPVTWEVSAGTDREQRESIIAESIASGLLTHSRASAALPSPKIDPAPLLLAEIGAEADSDAQRAAAHHLRRYLDSLNRAAAEKAEEKERERIAEKSAFEAKRKAMLKRVEEELARKSAA